MAHDVFISYASRDKVAADAICDGLERRGIRCWIAPRDIVPGVPWAESIIDAIEGSGVMLLIFSDASNKSVQVQREVERAVHKAVALVPLRIENVMPTRTMEYFISSQHWFDAIQPPIEQHLERLVQGDHGTPGAPLQQCTVGVTGPWSRRARRCFRRPPLAGAPAPSPCRYRCPRQRRPPRRRRPPPLRFPPDEPFVIGSYELGRVIATGRFGSVVYAGTASAARESSGGAGLPADRKGRQGSRPLQVSA